MNDAINGSNPSASRPCSSTSFWTSMRTSPASGFMEARPDRQLDRPPQIFEDGLAPGDDVGLHRHAGQDRVLARILADIILVEPHPGLEVGLVILGLEGG